MLSMLAGTASNSHSRDSHEMMRMLNLPAETSMSSLMPSALMQNLEPAQAPLNLDNVNVGVPLPSANEQPNATPPPAQELLHPQLSIQQELQQQDEKVREHTGLTQ
ncbi:MAG: hypothetical protein MHM6MM_007136 [Cercozoa sp. M6MM]